MAKSKLTNEQISQALVGIKEVLADMDDPADRASVCFEVGLENLCRALLDAGQEVTDRNLLATSHAMVAGFILTLERGERKLPS
jgi:hypothetical protein